MLFDSFDLLVVSLLELKLCLKNVAMLNCANSIDQLKQASVPYAGLGKNTTISFEAVDIIISC